MSLAGCSAVRMSFVLFLILAGTSALPVEEERSPSPWVDQSAESSEVESKVAPYSLELDASSEEQRHFSDENMGSSEHSAELQGGHQTFFPSFASLFEPRQPFSRLSYPNQEAAYSQRPNSYRSLLNYPLFGNYRNLENFGKPTTHEAIVDPNKGILGSGNFGVIKGGTFLGQSEGEDYDGFNDFYNNGHGRPSNAYTANPRPNYNQEQFANFRDFADINAPANTAYSQFIVVYANKNGTRKDFNKKTKKPSLKPNNINETLERLDDGEKTTKDPKISKAKAKLAKTKMPEKKQKWKITKVEKHEEEPLLALS